MNRVYLTKIEKYLPNSPVSNEEMEERLGLINGNTSKSRGLILRNNGIKTRYYALDQQGNITHNNAQLASLAINKLFSTNIRLADIQLLTAGTSSPDALHPAHALLVHGVLGGPSIETMSAHGTCNAGMLSLKYAYLAVLSGQVQNAVNVASETLSSWMLSRNFQTEIDKRKEIEDNPYIAFEKDFLRWMLSDGSVAALVQDKPNNYGLSLRIEWIDVKSFANELESCMYAGCVKNKDGTVTGWRELSTEDQNYESIFSLKQDAKLLQKHVIKKGIEHLMSIKKNKNFDESKVDYFLPHLSSMFFKKQAIEGFIEHGIDLPEHKWFMNLPKVGNVGAASAMLMIEELFNSGNLNAGENILVMIPESAQFSYTYLLLTVV